MIHECETFDLIALKNDVPDALKYAAADVVVAVAAVTFETQVLVDNVSAEKDGFVPFRVITVVTFVVTFVVMEYDALCEEKHLQPHLNYYTFVAAAVAVDVDVDVDVALDEDEIHFVPSSLVLVVQVEKLMNLVRYL